MDPQPELDSQPELPKCLLVHDGELSDLRRVLEDLGIPFTECRGALGESDQTTDWDLVLSTPNRILDLAPSGSPARIVVADNDSKTLRTSVTRAGIKTLVRRPVHPTALRGILLHALYRGPEKRRTKRVAVGAPVRVRCGLRQFPAILADLSLGGCRLIADRAIKSHKLCVVSIPGDVAPKSFRLKARVLRSVPASSTSPDAMAIHMAFQPLSQAKLKLLKQTIVAYRNGPAKLAATPGVAPAPAASPSPAKVAAPATAVESCPPLERRAERRQDIEQRVVALDEEADRVLMGRDISVGGMRVSQSPHLTIGCDVKLALHLSADAPLIVNARVHRDDGEQGVVLRYHQLTAPASAAIMKLMESMPVVGTNEPEDETGYVVSELLEVGVR